MLDLDEMDSQELETILASAEHMREVLERDVQQVPTLRGKTVGLLGFAHDVPTRVSFETAARALSATVTTLPLAAEQTNGAFSLVDMAQTLNAMGTSILVVQHPHEGTPYLLTRHFAGALINGGDGAHAHPSEALAHLLTIRTALPTFHGSKIVLVGNIIQSGTARSLLWGLHTLGADVTLCGPPTLVGPEEMWQTTWPAIQVGHNLYDVIEDAAVVVLLGTHVQDTSAAVPFSVREYRSFFTLTHEHLDLAPPDALVIPPITLHSGIDVAPDLVSILQPVRARQITHGTAIRMALFYHLAG
jgi:aspartate carbamoyltransferase catalytic subunit